MSNLIKKGINSNLRLFNSGHLHKKWYSSSITFMSNNEQCTQILSVTSIFCFLPASIFKSWFEHLNFAIAVTYFLLVRDENKSLKITFHRIWQGSVLQEMPRGKIWFGKCSQLLGVYIHTCSWRRGLSKVKYLIGLSVQEVMT